MRFPILAALFALTACSLDAGEEPEPGPTPSESMPAPSVEPSDALVEGEPQEHHAAAHATRINVNTADEAALMTISGMNERMVHEFEEYRPYVSIQQFRREIGKYVDEATVTSYEQHIYVPIQYNDSDAATIAQLPGVDDELAAKIIAERPYASKDAFLSMVGEQAGEEAADAAKMWLAE